MLELKSCHNHEWAVVIYDGYHCPVCQKLEAIQEDVENLGSGFCELEENYDDLMEERSDFMHQLEEAKDRIAELERNQKCDDDTSTSTNE